MITAKIIETFKKYKGYYDGYYVQNHNFHDQLISGDQWGLIESIIQDLYLVRMKRASSSFENSLNERLIIECDSKSTIDLLRNLEMYLNKTT